MATETKNENVTGLDQATNRKDAEYDLVKSLFMAANYKKAPENIVEIDITQGGRYLFTLHLHPIGDDDVALATKRSTKYKDHPQGKKYGKIEVGRDRAAYKSWLIYLATTEEDQKQIWGNRDIMSTFHLSEPWESVDLMLTVGDKAKLLEKITEISGLDDEDEDEAEMDEETFQP